jgi:hypothetical protein
MPTTPFDAALVASLKESDQSAYLALLKQWEDNPEFFCCISGNTVGVAKDPVPILTIADRVVCIGANVTVDFSLSWSPTSTLAGQPYTITWGDGSPNTNGNFPNPRNPAAETATYVGGYAAVGYYDITLEIQDAVGAIATTRIQIYARDCTQPPNPLPFPEAPAWPGHYVWNLNGAIVPSRDYVYYTVTLNAGAPTWVATSGAMIPAGTEINDVMLELESNGDEWIYAADFNRIYRHPMPPDVGNWTARVTAAQMVTAAGVDATKRTCICKRLAISVENDGWQWCSWQANFAWPNNVDDHFGVAHTQDGWATIEHSAIVDTITFDPAKTHRFDAFGIDIVQGNNGATVFVAAGRMDDVVVDENTRLYRSQDYGVSWSEVDSLVDQHNDPDVWVPYNSVGQGSVVYWANYKRLRKSVNGGGSWSNDIALPGASYTDTVRLCGPLNSTDIVTIIVEDELWESRSGAGTHITPDLPAANAGFGELVLARTVNRFADEILWVGVGTSIKINDVPAQLNKEGTWAWTYPWAIGKPELREYSDV